MLENLQIMDIYKYNLAYNYEDYEAIIDVESTYSERKKNIQEIRHDKVRNQRKGWLSGYDRPTP